MKIPNPYFENVPGYGNLVMDRIIVEYVYPLLSVLKDRDKNRYLCICFDTRGSQQWLIAPIQPSDLIKLLTNKISLDYPFKHCDKTIIFATRSYSTRSDSFLERTAESIPEEDLPPAGEYLDAEEGEWTDYITEINSEADAWMKTFEPEPIYSSKVYCIASYVFKSLSPQYQDKCPSNPSLRTTNKILCNAY